MARAELARRLSAAGLGRRRYSEAWIAAVEAGTTPLYPRDQRLLAAVLPGFSVAFYGAQPGDAEERSATGRLSIIR